MRRFRRDDPTRQVDWWIVVGFEVVGGGSWLCSDSVSVGTGGVLESDNVGGEDLVMVAADESVGISALDSAFVETCSSRPMTGGNPACEPVPGTGIASEPAVAPDDN